MKVQWLPKFRSSDMRHALEFLWAGKDRHCEVTPDNLPDHLYPFPGGLWVVLQISWPGGLCLSNSTTIAAGSFPLRFNTCHLSVSKLQRSKFPKTDLLCVWSVSGAAVHRDGQNPIFSLGFFFYKNSHFYFAFRQVRNIQF